MAALLTAVVAIAPSAVPAAHAPPRPHMPLDRLFGNWLQWDGWWYVAIARHGYTYRPHHMSSVAFFPVYPLVVRASGNVVPGGVPVAALVVTTVCGLLALLLAFSFSLALSRYEMRRSQILEEANAIGSTANFTLMLPKPAQGPTQKHS